ncbi:MAG: hypothetical protein JWO05_996 [Gemmatimonadetes bacterium]|nr:hypothetical protein [Gemmatimonadota bacterium]
MYSPIARASLAAAGLVAAACLIPATSFAQRAPARVANLTLADGRRLEVIGLRSWTPAMIQDSLARYAPGESLQSAGSADALRFQLGFADATMTATADRVVLSVREPQDSSLVHYRRMSLDTTAGRRDWSAVSDMILQRDPAFWAMLSTLGQSSAAGDLQITQAGNSRATTRALTRLRELRGDADYREARSVLTSSPNMFDRSVAVLIVGQHPERDDAWRQLAETARESDGMVKSVASEVLASWALRAPRTVDWTPVSAGINAMLNGTSVGELPNMISVLNRTGVGPANASAFLKNGGDMLVTFLDSRLYAQESRALLVRLRGADLGSSQAAWRAWISTL